MVQSAWKNSKSLQPFCPRLRSSLLFFDLILSLSISSSKSSHLIKCLETALPTIVDLHLVNEDIYAKEAYGPSS